MIKQTTEHIHNEVPFDYFSDLYIKWLAKKSSNNDYIQPEACNAKHLHKGMDTLGCEYLCKQMLSDLGSFT